MRQTNLFKKSLNQFKGVGVVVESLPQQDWRPRGKKETFHNENRHNLHKYNTFLSAINTYD